MDWQKLDGQNGIGQSRSLPCDIGSALAELEFRMNGVTSEAQGNGLVCVGAWRGSEYAART